MEASGGSSRRRRHGGGASASAAAPSSSSGKRRSAGRAAASIQSLGTDLLCAIFALLDHVQLVRCSVVCNSWKNIIYTSTLMRDLYYKKNLYVRGESSKAVSLEKSMKQYLEDLAMEQHRSAFLCSSAEVHQWNGHSVRVSLCRMKRGMILTGAEDKVLRLWSAETYNCLDEYPISNMNPLIDYDFDENKIVGLSGTRICIWKRSGQRSTFQSREGLFTRGLCMRYIDPEAVVGCEDGRARIFDMYSGQCSRIIRMHAGPISCLALTEDQLVLSGSTFGTVAIADLSTGEQLASLKSSFSPTGMKSLCFNMRSYLLFAGSTSGYAHCWDLRTLRPLWEMRVSPNVIYVAHHLWNDTSSLAVGGLDGVLRILNQNTGELLSSFVMDADNTKPISSTNGSVVSKRMARAIPEDAHIDSISRCFRPPITCLAVGFNKIVTTHNEKYIKMWRFGE